MGLHRVCNVRGESRHEVLTSTTVEGLVVYEAIRGYIKGRRHCLQAIQKSATNLGEFTAYVEK